MRLDRRPRRYRRRQWWNPSCMTLITIVLVVLGVIFFGRNATTVIDAIVPTPTPEPTRSAASYATSASLYWRDGDYESAITSYENAIFLDSQNDRYYVELINLYTLAGDVEGAQDAAQKVLLLAPEDDRVLAAVASAYLLNGDRLSEVGDRSEAELAYQEAIDTARQAISINPNNPEAYAYLAGGLIKQSRDNFQEAQEMVDLALAIDPQNARVRFYRAIVLENQGYYELAIEEYEQARTLDPSYTEPALALAYTYFYTDNRARAINVLRELIENNPNNPDLHDALGWMLFLAGQYPEAEVYLEDAVSLDPGMIRAKAHLGAAYYKNFNYELAIPQLEEAVTTYRLNYENGTPLTDSTALYFNYLAFAYYRTDPSLCYETRAPYQYNATTLFNIVLEAMGPDGIRGQNAQVGLEDCRQFSLGQGN